MENDNGRNTDPMTPLWIFDIEEFFNFEKNKLGYFSTDSPTEEPEEEFEYEEDEEEEEDEEIYEFEDEEDKVGGGEDSN